MNSSHKHWFLFWLTWAAWLIASVALSRADVLRLTLSGGFTEAQATACYKVEAVYNRMIVDRGLSPPFNVMQVTVRSVPIDGRWNVLAQSYGGVWVANAGGKYVNEGNGKIDIDSADLPFWSEATLSEVVFHETAHFFGFQSLIWQLNGCLDAGGQYVAPATLAVYQGERDPAALFVPTGDSHFAQSLSPWLMTPALIGSYVSRTFLAVLADNGNTLSAWALGFQGGNLSTILPRRVLRVP